MGRHGDKDKPADSGTGGPASDGERPTQHGTEGMPPQTGDGQRPT